MTNPVNTREIVLDILLEVNKNNIFSHVAINQMLGKYQYLEKRDRAFITRLAEGTLEYKLQLDYVINQFSKVRVNKMKPVIREIMRMSVYQIMHMDSIPDSAVCNEAVKLAAKRGFFNLKGFVNGVLRNIVRNIDTIEYPDEKDTIKYLSVKYSTPEWIIEKWLKVYDAKLVGQILRAGFEDKGTSVRMVTGNGQITTEQIIESLQNDGAAVERSSYYDMGLIISNYDYLGMLDAFEDGYIVPQDISSMMVGKIASPKKNDYVIDVCAAPGGKSLHIADMMYGTGTVDARDLSEHKVALIDENIMRTGHENITAKVWDATVTDQSSIEKADILICDLPCSGLGIIGRKPDIKYNMTQEKQDDLVKLQKSILKASADYVKKNGRMIYSTCTINQDENEKMVEWIEENLPFEAYDIGGELPDSLLSDTTEKGYIQFLPGIHKSDGFFVAGFRRKQD